MLWFAHTFCFQNDAWNGTKSARLMPSFTTFLSWLEGFVWKNAELQVKPNSAK